MVLTIIRADGEGENPEEEGQCQGGTQHNHISHHLHVLLHQHIILKGHDEGQLELQNNET